MVFLVHFLYNWTREINGVDGIHNFFTWKGRKRTSVEFYSDLGKGAEVRCKIADGWLTSERVEENFEVQGILRPHRTII